ncbi:MAG: OmpA family protein [Alphaproteobacteria bacterium]|nr:OmpA family protein [Alphaproteobacteria bacterium]MBN2779818.1 OmpA family protein [Alphaproteobacteria bacterium]
MRFLITLTLLLAGCQSSLTPLPQTEEAEALYGVSFGRMTANSKQNKAATVKKGGFIAQDPKTIQAQIDSDFAMLKDNLEPLGVSVNKIGYDIILTVFGEQIFQNRLSLKLKPTAETTLGEIGSYLEKRKNSYVEITGYTDSVGNANANQRLSVAKARRLTLYFIQEGFSPLRFFINGRGENSPISNEASLNRRFDIRISPMIK